MIKKLEILFNNEIVNEKHLLNEILQHLENIYPDAKLSLDDVWLTIYIEENRNV